MFYVVRKKQNWFLQVCTPSHRQVESKWLLRWSMPAESGRGVGDTEGRHAEERKFIYNKKKKSALPRKMFNFSLTILWSSAKLPAVMSDKSCECFWRQMLSTEHAKMPWTEGRQGVQMTGVRLLQMGDRFLHGNCKNWVAMRTVKKIKW